MTQTAHIQLSQKLDLSDVQHLAEFPRDAADALITSAIEAGSSYAGASVTKSGTTTVAIEAPAYLYKGGKLFTSADALADLDFLGQLRPQAIAASWRFCCKPMRLIQRASRETSGSAVPHRHLSLKLSPHLPLRGAKPVCHFS
ncbi:MAG: hypothetical protein AAF141_02795 [Pseudomonadota bacterium]